MKLAGTECLTGGFALLRLRRQRLWLLSDEQPKNLCSLLKKECLVDDVGQHLL